MGAVLDELGLADLVTTIAGLTVTGAAAILAETGYAQQVPCRLPQKPWPFERNWSAVDPSLIPIPLPSIPDALRSSR